MDLGSRLLLGLLLAMLFALLAPASVALAANPKKLVADGAQLLDVRSEEEFERGHIDGALNIPIDELEFRIDELTKGRGIVVYCQSGKRSAYAAKLLRKAGFNAVYDMGAMSRWRRPAHPKRATA